LVVWGSLGLASTVLLEAALSFLGVGVQPPTPSWGGIINESQIPVNYEEVYLK